MRKIKRLWLDTRFWRYSFVGLGIFFLLIVVLNIVQSFVEPLFYPPARPSFQVGESDVYDAGSGEVFWLDDDHLVFSGNVEQYFSVHGKTHIYIWKMGGVPKAYRPDQWRKPETWPSDNYLCADNGNVYYNVTTRKYGNKTDSYVWTATVMAGRPGHETPSVWHFGSNVRGVNTARNEAPLADKNSKICTDYRDVTLAGHYWLLSHDRKTVLDFGRYNDGAGLSGPIRLLRLPDHAEIPIQNIPTEWAVGTCAQVMTWENSFVTWACPGGDVKYLDVETFPVWKIFSDGRVEEHFLQVGGLWGVHLVSTRVGYFAIAGGNKDGKGRQNMGLFYVQPDGRMKWIAQGFLSLEAVSPNGCLAAFSKATNLGKLEPLANKLVVFDLCKAAREMKS